MDCEICGCDRATTYDAYTRWGIRSLCEPCHDQHAYEPVESDDSAEDGCLWAED